MITLASTPSTQPAWYEVAAAFTMIHVAALALFIPMIAASSMLGCRWRGTPREVLFRRTWAISILLFLGGTSVYYVLPGNYVPGWSLPIHVCDVMGFVSCLALLLPFRWLKTTTVFLGLALCTQAFITPVVKVGPIYLHFWYFWLGHVAIVGGAIYIIVVDRYRPTLADLGVAWLTLSAYVGWVLPLDISEGWNYGFVGNPPPRPDEPPTIVEHLGPWPQRVYWLGVLGCGAMGLVYLGFQVPGWVARLRGRRAEDRGPADAPPTL
jgi:hypothetical integral membrane protein (TIGR02206 family)